MGPYSHVCIIEMKLWYVSTPVGPLKNDFFEAMKSKSSFLKRYISGNIKKVRLFFSQAYRYIPKYYISIIKTQTFDTWPPGMKFQKQTFEIKFFNYNLKNNSPPGEIIFFSGSTYEITYMHQFSCHSYHSLSYLFQK